MTCVSQSLPYVAVALGGLQVPRLLARRGVDATAAIDWPEEDSCPPADDGATSSADREEPVAGSTRP